MSEPRRATEELSETGRTYAPHEAVIEASRCLMCEDPPCNAGCPAGVDVRRFVRKIRFGNFRGAARLIRDANIFVGTCGRVCPTEMLCVENCTRTELDIPIDIGGLQQFAGDVELGELAPLPDDVSERSERVAVVGAGPAGLAAAAALRKMGFIVDVLERTDTAGGVLTQGIPPFRLDRSFVESEISYVERLGARIRLGVENVAPAELIENGYDAVFLAVGVWRPYTLDIEGGELEGVLVAGDFLMDVARGGRPDVGRDVVVIGGGNVAIDAATTALRLGAERVTACSLERGEELPAFRSEIEEAQSEGVEFRMATRPVRILGEGGRVTGYEGVGISWKEPGLLVPSNAEDVPGTAFSLAADTVIEAIGQGVRDRFEGVETDGRGFVLTDAETMATSMRGVFAGGDIVSGGATVVQAVAEGKRAADGIRDYLDGLSPERGAASGKGGERR